VEFRGNKAMTALRRIAAIVAHPDDEVLGCGGALARHAAHGDEVSIVILADGETSREGGSSAASVAKREMAAHAAASILGAKQVLLHGLSDNRLDAQPRLELVKIVEKHIQEIAPDVVYTHHVGDVNVDHRYVHEAAVTACRPQPGNPVKTLLFFETPSSTEWQPPFSGQSFLPNWFVDISDVLECKMRALRAYDDEMRPWPHPRSYEAVEYLARLRGATVGCAAAEAFMLGRAIRDKCFGT
jgi:LmbE family N-acetylglucosaminyl deacetylase